MKVFIVFFISFTLSSLASNNLLRIRTVLKQVESNGDAKAIGDNGRAYGILQIHKICVEDINRVNGTTYTHEDAFNEELSEEMFCFYINKGIKLFIDKYDSEPTEEQIVRMWNGGYYTGYNRSTTIKYYNRYIKFKNKFN